MNQSGQAMVEYILVSLALLGIGALVYTTLSEKQTFHMLAKAPWSYMRGMIENGVWQPVEQSKFLHPNSLSNNRLGTVRDE